MHEETSVASLIRRARQRKRMTQRQLAEKVGVTHYAVRHWESGTHYPARYAGAIEDVLGITLPDREKAAS